MDERDNDQQDGQASTPTSDAAVESPEEYQPVKVDMDAISVEVRRQFEAVPEIGTRWRWYDVPYRILTWLLGGWRRKWLPWRGRRKLNDLRNWFSTINHYERLKVERLDNPSHNLIVPENEQVIQGGMWVVEFFPPSHYDGLLKALSKNGWDTAKLLHSIDGSNAEQVMRARRGRGFLWTRLGAVANPNARYLTPDVKHEVLPSEFDLVDLTGVQIGTSLTAVVAFFRFSESGQRSLDRVWKARHEPILEWRGLSRPRTDSRYFSAIRATQWERQRLHDVARTWLADRCAGYFATTEHGQPVVDLSLFAKFDPTTSVPGREERDALRALGMDNNGLYNFVSPQIPGAVLAPGDALRRDDTPLQNCWGVMGSQETFSEANDQPGYGPKPYSVGTLAGIADDAVRSFILNIAVVQYALTVGETLAVARDTARAKHKRFSSRQLEALRTDLLTSSLDLPSVARDTAKLWEKQWLRQLGIQVKGVTAPGIERPIEEFDFLEELGDRRAKVFEQLLEDDRAYRDVLSTAASLGANAASVRLGRRALLVSVFSLLVAAMTLIAVDGEKLWKDLAGFLP